MTTYLPWRTIIIEINTFLYEIIDPLFLGQSHICNSYQISLDLVNAIFTQKTLIKDSI